MKKICVVVASRMNYGRVKTLMQSIKDHNDFDLLTIAGASTLLERFGNAVDVMRRDGFTPDKELYYLLEGSLPMTQAKSTGMGILELSTAFSELSPDAIVTVADRFETMSTAISASYMNIPLIHLQGGEVSGNIDDKVRNAITKLSDYHFTCSDESRKRVIEMGEDPDRVFNFGCPSLDLLNNQDLSISNEIMGDYIYLGDEINWELPYILMIQHPVTTSYGQGFFQINETLHALSEIDDIQKIIMWPNVDAGTDEVSKGIRMFREKNLGSGFTYHKNFSPEIYSRIINNAACCVGNSSSFIREASFLGVPAVMVGDRQKDREHGSNVIFSPHQKKEIYKRILSQLDKNRFDQENIFGDGSAGINITKKLSEINFTLK